MEAVGKIFDRMSELRTMASDITKNSGDVENYSKEFVELQLQLDQIKNDKYNGISLFAGNGLPPGNGGLKETGFYRKSNGSQVTYEKFGRILQASPSSAMKTVSINVVNLEFVASYDALDPSKVQVNAIGYADRITDFAISLFTDAMGKITDIRAENGAEQNRLRYALISVESFYANMEAAHGSIMDADIAAESTRFARSNILVQSSSSMTVQAKQLTSLALTLIQ